MTNRGLHEKPNLASIKPAVVHSQLTFGSPSIQLHIFSVALLFRLVHQQNRRKTSTELSNVLGQQIKEWNVKTFSSAIISGALISVTVFAVASQEPSNSKTEKSE